MIINKLARNLQILGYTIVSQGNSAANPVEPLLVVSNGSNNLYITYIPSAFTPSMIGGVEPAVSPFLGIGSANPGQLCLQSVLGTSVATIMDGQVAAQVLCSMASFANDIIIANNTTPGNPAIVADQLARIRGSSDLLNMGQ